MANYDKNFETMIGGHLFGDDSRIKIDNYHSANKTPSDMSADVRDILTDIVGNSYKGLSDENIKAQYAKLSGLVGITQAQKLMDTALIYNQNPANMKLPLEQRVQGFYNAGSQDKSLNAIIQGAGKLGQGPIAGMNSSSNVGNQKLAGNYDNLPVANNDDIIQVDNKKLR